MNIEADVREIFLTTEHLSRQTTLWLKNHHELTDSMDSLTSIDQWTHRINIGLENVHHKLDSLDEMESRLL